MLKICVVGALGRMGQEIAKVIDGDPALEVHSKVDRTDDPASNTTQDLLKGAADCDLIIDFSGANGTFSNMPLYKDLKKPLLIGSTGLSALQLEELRTLQSDMPLLISSNMSVGVNVLLKAVEMAAHALGEDFDIEVFEAHHKHKVDAPSGTALILAEAAAHGREIDLAENAVFARVGVTGARKEGTIGFQVLRGGDIAGDHTIFFCGEGECIELTHRASNRTIFAKGAVRAAKWLFGKPNGLYTMNDVLGL